MVKNVVANKRNTFIADIILRPWNLAHMLAHPGQSDRNMEALKFSFLGNAHNVKNVLQTKMFLSNKNSSPFGFAG